jgi:hypothetical protein
VGSVDKEQRILEARVTVLEKQVQFLLRINGIDVSALRDATDEELLQHYRAAVQAIGKGRRTKAPQILKQWAELFCQISEFEVARLQGIVNYTHTWEPFYHLCIKLMTAMRQRKEFAVDFQLQQIYGLLDKGRKNLREVALVTMEKYPENLAPKAKILLKEANFTHPL